MVVAITMHEMAFVSVGVGDQRVAKHAKPENYHGFYVLVKIFSPYFRKYQNFENLSDYLFNMVHSESIPVFGSTASSKLIP